MTSRAKRPAKAAGIAGFSAAVAVALVQVLQQTVGAFTERPGIKVAIVFAAFFAGFVGARLRERSTAKSARAAREEHLPTLLAVWPAPRSGDADPSCLGVFPSRRDLPAERPYIERDLDRHGGLQPAIVPGALVVVVGEARAGASRTALEAVGRALPDAAVVAPRSADALAELLELDPQLRLSGGAAVVWLDGIDRYAEVLDDRTLDALDDLADGVTVVATVRKDDWDAWLNASGAKAPAARAVAERARVFELPAALSRGELAKAAALYPGREFGPGIGAALASDGREQLPPSPAPELEGGMGEPTSDTPWFRDPPLIVPLVATALALVACAIVVATKGWRTPSIQDQLTSIKHKGSLGGTRSVIIHTADLHGNGDNSYIVYFRDRTAQSPRSDELRIYDKHGETLRRAFRFAPTGRRAQFEYRALLDVDGDGATELVGGWDFPDEARNAMVPFAVDWDDGANRYNLVPLDLGAPKLKPHAVKLAKNFRTPAKQYLTLYAAPTTFPDPRDKVTLTGHRVQDFTVSEAPYRMIAGWFLKPWLNVRTLGVLEVQVAIFARNTGAPRLTPCTFRGAPDPLLVGTREERALESVFHEVYTGVSQGRFCSPYAAPTGESLIQAAPAGAP